MPQTPRTGHWSRFLGDRVIVGCLFAPVVAVVAIALVAGPMSPTPSERPAPAQSFSRTWQGYRAGGILDLHHPYGGTVAEVLVAPGQSVSQGQILVLMDVEMDRAALLDTRAEIDRLTAELSVIHARLGLSGRPDMHDPLVTRFMARYDLLRDTMMAESADARSRAAVAEDRAQWVRHRIEDHDRLHQPVVAADRKPRTVFRNGRLIRVDPVAEPQATPERVDLVQRLGQAEAIAQRAAASHVAAQERYIAFLQARSEAILAALPALQDRAIALANRIEAAHVRAPVDGTVLEIAALRAGSTVDPGATVAVIRTAPDGLGRTQGSK